MNSCVHQSMESSKVKKSETVLGKRLPLERVFERPRHHHKNREDNAAANREMLCVCVCV